MASNHALLLIHSSRGGKSHFIWAIQTTYDTGGSLSVRDPIEWPLLFLPRFSAMEAVRLLLSHATDGGDKERIKTCSGKG